MSDQPSHENTATKGQSEASAAELRRIRQITPQEFDIRIAADGAWYHEGGHIGRPALVRLFASVLQREPDGSYWLVTPVERGRITVDDVPFIITSMTVDGVGRNQNIRFRTNVEDEVILSSGHPLSMHLAADGTTPEPRPYVTIRGTIEARIARPVFYELADLCVEDERGIFGVWSNGAFFSLSESPPDETPPDETPPDRGS